MRPWILILILTLSSLTFAQWEGIAPLQLPSAKPVTIHIEGKDVTCHQVGLRDFKCFNPDGTIFSPHYGPLPAPQATPVKPPSCQGRFTVWQWKGESWSHFNRRIIHAGNNACAYVDTIHWQPLPLKPLDLSSVRGDDIFAGGCFTPDRNLWWTYSGRACSKKVGVK